MSSAVSQGNKRQRSCFFAHLAPEEMASFVRKDYDILSSQYRMRNRMYRGTYHGYPDRLAIWWGVNRSDFNFSWFGYTQAYWAVRFSKSAGKKSIVVLGGFDVCEEEDPLLNRRLPAIRYILQNADRLLAGSKRVRDKALELGPDARVDVMYHGFDADMFKPGDRKEKLAVTVGFVRRQNLKRKGLEVFVKSAALVPDCRFLIVGKWLDDAVKNLRTTASPNVEFAGELDDTELIRTLQRASVYVQASTHEGFGCSLAEAMLCGCAPVVSDRGAIPEVVGDTGIYIDPDSAKDVAAGVSRALENPKMGGLARDRIASLFPLAKRREALLSTVRELLS